VGARILRLKLEPRECQLDLEPREAGEFACARTWGDASRMREKLENTSGTWSHDNLENPSWHWSHENGTWCHKNVENASWRWSHENGTWCHENLENPSRRWSHEHLENAHALEPGECHHPCVFTKEWHHSSS
jgi:hypothetical protein